MQTLCSCFSLVSAKEECPEHVQTIFDKTAAVQFPLLYFVFHQDT